MTLEKLLKKIIISAIVFSALWLTNQIVTPVEAAGPANQGNGTYKIFLPIVSKPLCNFIIGPQVSVADGRDNYGAVRPGDIVCILGGARGELALKNFQGTEDNPITFTNFNGQVTIDSDDWYGILIHNSQYFRLTGSGEGLDYGIKIVRSQTHGLRIGRKSENFEVDHIEVSGASSIGIVAQTKPVCSDGSSNDYDYDNDGFYENDLDDVVNRSNFTQRNSIFHHNYVHNVGTEGFYIGSSYYLDEKEEKCDSGTETLYDSMLHGVHIYENIVADTGWDGIQVGSANQDCTIHHNKIYRDSRANERWQESGILNNPGSVCHIYNNLIKEGGSKGIYINAYGGNRVYNNLIIDPGQNVKESGIVVGRSSSFGGEIAIFNNTIVNPPEYGINYRNEQGSNNFIENNIVVNPGMGLAEAIKVSDESVSNVTVSNNYVTMDINELKFVDPSSDNYALQDNSPAVDSGTPQAITIDYANAPRPQGAGFDIGATER